MADLDLGGWRGRPLADLAASELAAWRSDPTFAGHGGESLASHLARVKAWLDGLLAGGGTHLAVTHAAVMRCAVLAALGAPAAGFWNVDVAPLTRIVFTSDTRRWSLREMIVSRA